MATSRPLAMEDVLRVNGSHRFAAAPFTSPADALLAARRIWLNEVDVNGWLEAFAAQPAIGTTSPSVSMSVSLYFCLAHSFSSSPLSVPGLQSLQVEQRGAIGSDFHSHRFERAGVAEWNAKYREKFGFVFMICASGRTAPEVLAELKRRYANRPIVELEGAAQEELKITELRLAKLVSSETAPTTSAEGHISHLDKAAAYRVSTPRL